MKALDVYRAFSLRKISDVPKTVSEFENLACSLARLRESDQLNILPALMGSVLENSDFGGTYNYADMIIYVIMPQPDGWKNLIESMNDREIDCVAKWLTLVEGFGFASVCSNEMASTVALFNNNKE